MSFDILSRAMLSLPPPLFTLLHPSPLLLLPPSLSSFVPVPPPQQWSGGGWKHYRWFWATWAVRLLRKCVYAFEGGSVRAWCAGCESTVTAARAKATAGSDTGTALKERKKEKSTPLGNIYKKRSNAVQCRMSVLLPVHTHAGITVTGGKVFWNRTFREKNNKQHFQRWAAGRDARGRS